MNLGVWVYFVGAPTGENTEYTLELECVSDDMARFEFVRQMAGMMVSRDLKPSELRVRKATRTYVRRYHPHLIREANNAART